MIDLSLPKSLAPRLASGHPWVYRDHLGKFRAKTGSWVKVQAGTWVGYGLYDQDSPIAVRIFSTLGQPDRAWVKQRVEEAYALRAGLRAQGVTGYRWLFGEADGLPAIVVDRYADYAILLSYSPAVEALLPWVADALWELGELKGVLRRTKQDGKVKLTLLHGEAPPPVVVVDEYGALLGAELYAGQKTGLFFDHRENRAYVRQQAAGARMLNLFSYTGGFSVAAALGGARAVTSVDISAPAIASCEENFKLNGLADFPHTVAAEDVYDWLGKALSRGQKYDLVVCDPPSFAHSKEQLPAAEQAYIKVLTAALKVTEAEGLFCAASCTSQVSPENFRYLIGEACRKAKVRFQIVHEVGQAPDHPVLAAQEESRYLKFVVGRIRPRV